jgi:hypothetical protein
MNYSVAGPGEHPADWDEPLPQRRQGRCATCETSGDATWLLTHQGTHPEHVLFYAGQRFGGMTRDELVVEVERRR